MNRVFGKLLNSISPAFNATGSKLLPASASPGIFQGHNVVREVLPHREIHNYERPFRLALRGRLMKEKFKHPERFTKPYPRYGFLDWNYTAELFAFGKRLGEDFDDGLLREALTDESFIHKERLKQEKLGMDPQLLNIQHNKELSIHGFEAAKDVLVKFIQKEFSLLPEEGQKAVLSHLMSNKTMADVAFHLGLKDLILCEEYPPSEETYTRAMYAVIGALHQATESRTEKFVVDFIASLLCGKDVNEYWDIPRPWQMMEKLSKEKNLSPVEARLMREAGRNTIHAVFVVGVYDKDKNLLGTGIGETMDIAQEMSARDVLKGFFNTREPREPFEFQSANIPYKLIPQVRNIHK